MKQLYLSHMAHDQYEKLCQINLKADTILLKGDMQI